MLIRLAHNAGPLGTYRQGPWRLPMGNTVSPAMFGMVRTDQSWTAGFQHYNSDRLQEAFEAGNESGVGPVGEYAEALQIIDAEQATGQRSEITRINDWLEVESIPGASTITPFEIGEAAEDAIRTIHGRIGFKVGQPVLVTILAAEVVLPAHLDRSGYVTVKEPYAKYCLPDTLAPSLQLLQPHLEGLAACHAAGGISAESAAPWMIAASQALSSLWVAEDTRLQFCGGQIKWVEPSELSLRLVGLHLGEEPHDRASAALAQAILVGRYLLSIGKPAAFRECLAYHAPQNLFHAMQLLATNDPTRDVCKKVYGHAPEYLFEQALASCCKDRSS